MENFVTPSSSLEIEHVDSTMHTHQQNQSQSDFDSWLNQISVDALACSMERLCLCDSSGSGAATAPPVTNHCSSCADPIHGQLNALCVPNCSTHGDGQLNVLCVPNCSTHGEHSLQHHNFSSFEHVKAQLISLAQPYHRLGNPEVIEMVLWQIKDHLCDLMMEQPCNYLIQSVFEVSSVDHITRFLGLVLRNDAKLEEVCMHNHGTRAIQKLLENLKTLEQVTAAIFAVRRITVKLSKNFNGGCVIQHCFKLFPPALTRFIIDEVAKNCVEIATDKIGYSIFQKCLHHAKGDAMRELVEKTVSLALVLTEHPYGNYVVQCVVKMKLLRINATIISQLRGKFAQLSTKKHASYVVEKLLEFSEERDAAIIIQEIMYHRNFVRILQHSCGNFVVQRALRNCKGPLNKMLSDSILFNYPHLCNHFYGKRVLEFVKRRENYIQRNISK